MNRGRRKWPAGRTSDGTRRHFGARYPGRELGMHAESAQLLRFLCLGLLSSTVVVQAVCGRMIWHYSSKSSLLSVIILELQGVVRRHQESWKRMLRFYQRIRNLRRNGTSREDHSRNVLNKQCKGSRTHVLEMFLVICFDASLKDVPSHAMHFTFQTYQV